MEQRQPRNIFEQIVMGQTITNDNIVALAENLDVVNKKVDALLAFFNTPLGGQDNSEPNVPGTEADYQ